MDGLPKLIAIPLDMLHRIAYCTTCEGDPIGNFGPGWLAETNSKGIPLEGLHSTVSCKICCGNPICRFCIGVRCIKEYPIKVFAPGDNAMMRSFGQHHGEYSLQLSKNMLERTSPQIKLIAYLPPSNCQPLQNQHADQRGMQCFEERAPQLLPRPHLPRGVVEVRRGVAFAAKVDTRKVSSGVFNGMESSIPLALYHSFCISHHHAASSHHTSAPDLSTSCMLPKE